MMRFGQVVSYARTPRDFDYESVSAFLTATRTGDVPIYVGCGDWFMYGIVVPETALTGDWVSDVMGWNHGVPEGYGYGYRFVGNTIDPELSEPLESFRSEVLGQGRATVFMRYWDRRPPQVDPEQRLIHTLGLHHVPEKDAWCAINELGEVVPRLRVDNDDGWVCTLDRDDLDLYLVASRSCLVRIVDVTRMVEPGPRTHGPIVEDREREIFLQPLNGDTLVNLRGFDVLRVSAPTRARVLLRMQRKEPREYASFTIHDFKHGNVVEASSDPKDLGNYFVQSELPFETSPVFFKPDVLTQFRVDPGRFKVLPDRVVCIGAWELPYYINDDGQVHAYLIDLSRLPHPVQLLWKAFNEPPKGGIAKRAWKQDFEARWDLDYDALESLLKILRDFPTTDSEGRPVELWALRELPETRGLDFLGYVVTDAKKELEDQLVVLTQIAVEGLKRGTVNRLADKLGCRDKDLGSLKQLGLVMTTLGIDEEVRSEILGPLLEMQAQRSSKIAHRGTGPIAENPKAYWRKLLERTDRGMRALAELVERGRFNVGEP